jgi:hypothetical protein
MKYFLRRDKVFVRYILNEVLQSMEGLGQKKVADTYIYMGPVHNAVVLP